MTALWTWVQGNRWALWLAGAVAIIAVVFALVLGMRKSAEAAGRAAERLDQQRRAIDAEKRARAVPRPDRDDVDERLRDGTF